MELQAMLHSLENARMLLRFDGFSVLFARDLKLSQGQFLFFQVQREQVSLLSYYLKIHIDMDKAKFEKVMGVIGTVTAVLMYVFYINTIINNLNGQKGDWIQPLMACINCIIWVSYGLFKERRDWPVALANAPGIIFGFIAAITAL